MYSKEREALKKSINQGEILKMEVLRINDYVVEKGINVGINKLRQLI